MATAIQAIYRDLEYAKTLARQRSIASSTPFSPTPAADGGEQAVEDDLGDIDEWTFIGDETDVGTSKRVRERGVSDTGVSDYGTGGL